MIRRVPKEAKWWALFWAKCGAATWLVHTATGLGWLQSLAAVALVLWGGLEALRALTGLLEAFLGHSDGGENDDGSGEREEVPPVIIRMEPQKPHQEWKN